MPLTTNESRAEYEKSQNGLLDISASEFYMNKVRPHMKDIEFSCHTDPELVRTVTSTLNKADGDVARSDWAEVDDAFSVLRTAISDKNYFLGVISKASEEEKGKVRQLISLIDDFFLIIKAEKPVQKKDPEAPKRLNYREDETDPYRGQNGDYPTHNMERLTAPDPDYKPRIPNR